MQGQYFKMVRACAHIHMIYKLKNARNNSCSPIQSRESTGLPQALPEHGPKQTAFKFRRCFNLQPGRDPLRIRQTENLSGRRGVQRERDQRKKSDRVGAAIGLKPKDRERECLGMQKEREGGQVGGFSASGWPDLTLSTLWENFVLLNKNSSQVQA